MKALLYKDACVLWKQMKFMLLIVAIFCLLPNGFGLNAFFVAYAGLMLPMTLLAYDERARWDSFAAMLPYSPRAVVVSRYAAGWLLTLFAGGMYCLGVLVRGEGLPALAVLGWVVTAVLVCQAVLFPYFFRVGVEKARMYLIVFCVLLLVVGAGLAGLLDAALPTLSALMALAPVGVAVGVVVCLASVPVAERQYARRSW